MEFSPCIIIGLLMATSVAHADFRPDNGDNFKKLATANNHLALSIHKELTTKATSSGNVFFSPFSLTSAFGMLYLGSRGETERVRFFLQCT